MNSLINTNLVKQKALDLGFHQVGIAAITETEQNRQHLQSWLDQGYAADMAWMNSPKRQNIRELMPEVASVICVALNNYTPDQAPDNPE